MATRKAFILCVAHSLFLQTAMGILHVCMLSHFKGQSYLALWDPMDCSPRGVSVHGDSPSKNTGVGSHVLLQGVFPTQGSNPDLSNCRWILYHLNHQGSPAAAASLQSCPTLCDPIEGSQPGFPSLGFSRQEHWSGVPFPSPMHESEKWKWSRSVVSDSSDLMDCSLPGSSIHGIF